MIRQRTAGTGPATAAPFAAGRSSAQALRRGASILAVAVGLLVAVPDSTAQPAPVPPVTAPPVTVPPAPLAPTDAPGDSGWTEPTGATDVADPARGPTLWRKCRACHGLRKGARHSVGPNLYGLFGRRAGTAEGYNYSKAMRDSGLVWTDRNLDTYLAATQDVIPGSKMYGGLAIARDRLDLLAWLRSVTRPAEGN